MSLNHVMGDNRSDPKHPEKCWGKYIIYISPFYLGAFFGGAFFVIEPFLMASFNPGAFQNCAIFTGAQKIGAFWHPDRWKLYSN